MSEQFKAKPGKLYTVLVTNLEKKLEPRRYFFTASDEEEAMGQFMLLGRGGDKISYPEEVNWAVAMKPMPVTDFYWNPVKGKAAKAGK
jgi:hypothetical protein